MTDPRVGLRYGTLAAVWISKQTGFSGNVVLRSRCANIVGPRPEGVRWDGLINVRRVPAGEVKKKSQSLRWDCNIQRA